MTHYARIYLRRNGSFGASYQNVQDTGHFIAEDSGAFTVYSVHDCDECIASAVNRAEAENAIANDWDREFVR